MTPLVPVEQVPAAPSSVQPKVEHFAKNDPDDLAEQNGPALVEIEVPGRKIHGRTLPSPATAMAAGMGLPAPR